MASVRRSGCSAPLVVIAALFGIGCGNDGPREGDAHLLRARGRHLLDIVAAPSPNPDTNFSLVLSGRVSESGKHVLLVDMRPPYLRVYRRSGELRSAFLRRGRGPAESRGVMGVAVAGDSLILVADIDGRVRTFDLDGHLRQNLPEFPFGVISATTACPGEWLLYGARFSADGRSAQWLHRLPIGAGPESLAGVFAEPVSSTEPRTAMANGLVATRSGVALWHHLGPAPALVTWHCGAASASFGAIDDGATPPPPPRKIPGGIVTATTPGSHLRGGLAGAAGALFKSEFVNATAKVPEYSEVAAVAARRNTPVRLPGWIVLLDSRPGVGVLMQVYRGEEQRIILLSERDFLALAGGEGGRP
ncbi:hypothetical protein [Longimicrobium sp.]|uniref:hypothetical protein n=1 Tax=Longimicrobium sp. TaxID=2029185 RepID=UPI002ED79AA2